jgi:UDP-GlcNAc:undecaprenyl-phosphate/decaprenyl-phosphate GlcNAc-1-phosphate transferase
MLKYLIFLIAFNFLLFLFQKKIDLIINVYDKPDKIRKLHRNLVPLTGGLYLILNILSIVLVDFILNEKIFFFKELFYYNRIYFSLISGIILFFLLGLFDDKKAINANLKLVIQFIIIFIILLLDPNLKIEFLRLSFVDQIFYLNEFSLFFTIFCLLLFINAFNMFDGINGQSGLYFFVCLLVFYLTSQKTIFLLLMINLAFFLYKNIKNKIFLGNSGSYLISFLISFYFIKFYNVDLIIFADFIFLVMLIPGIDMLRVSFLRISKGINPFFPDRRHLHHILLKKFNQNSVVLLIFLLILIPVIINYYFLNTLIIITTTTLIYSFLIFISIKK